MFIEKNGSKHPSFLFGIKLKYPQNDETEYPDSNMSYKTLNNLIAESNYFDYPTIQTGKTNQLIKSNAKSIKKVIITT